LNSSGAWVHSNVWAAARPTATYGTNGLHFHFADPLGTRRVQASALGADEESCKSMPFGNGPTCIGGSDATERHFTGKERDTESGNGYFGARYYGSSMGRCVSPDRSAKIEPAPYAKRDNPQSLNLYAYAGNNPLSHMDKDGHYECSGSKEQCAAIKTGLQVIKNADANLKAGSSGKVLLDDALKFYGAEGEENGVKIDFKYADPKALGATSTANGITTISFGKDAFTPMGPTGNGETVAQEGTHGVDQHKGTANQMPTTFWQFYDTEYDRTRNLPFLPIEKPGRTYTFI
jgi:RHS repeat-associated protein